MSIDFKPTFIQWYEGDFQSDLVVSRRMNARQRALYGNLIRQSYFNAVRPYLPADDAKLWELADAENLQEWLDNKDAVLVKFQITDDGCLYNKRVLEEWDVLVGRLEQRKNAGKASAEARRKAKSPKEQKNIEQKNTGQNITSTTHKSVEHSLTTVERPLNDRPDDAVDDAPRTPVLSAGRERDTLLIELGKAHESSCPLSEGDTPDWKKTPPAAQLDALFDLHAVHGSNITLTVAAYSLFIMREDFTRGEEVASWPLKEFTKPGVAQEHFDEAGQLLANGFDTPNLLYIATITGGAEQFSPEDKELIRNAHVVALRKAWNDYPLAKDGIKALSELDKKLAVSR